MLLDFADISLTKKGELYHEIYKSIKSAVENSIIKKGEKLPSVREAAAQLGVSRTTVENAYTRLCIEGFAESIPQRGYFILSAPQNENTENEEIYVPDPEILYDFSSRRVDNNASDTEMWKKMVREVLRDSGELISYGDPQGELRLRQALADYSFKSRGVVTRKENIIVGAGMGPLLNILCGILGRDISVGFENNGFFEAEKIFSDYGISTSRLTSDRNGALIKDLEKSGANILFQLPSALPKISPSSLSKRRNEFVLWANEKSDRLIIEDDYNGELRYSARSMPAFQNKAPQKTVYIGSFSKLLLPSVRIAYMVLPDFLADKFKSLSNCYNQTCGKIEQLTLEKYIVSGALEKHLRKLRRLYYSKSQILCRNLEENLSCFKNLTLLESSLSVELETDLDFESSVLCEIAIKNGIRVIKSDSKGCVKLSFAGITTEKIPDAVNKLNKIFGNL